MAIRGWLQWRLTRFGASQERKIGSNMSKGPKWSQENVMAMLVVLRSKVEALDGMTEEQLCWECGKRLELQIYIGKGKEAMKTALKDWAWGHATGVGVVSEYVGGECKVHTAVGPVNLDKELEVVVELLKGG